MTLFVVFGISSYAFSLNDHYSYVMSMVDRFLWITDKIITWISISKCNDRNRLRKNRHFSISSHRCSTMGLTFQVGIYLCQRILSSASSTFLKRSANNNVSFRASGDAAPTSWKDDLNYCSIWQYRCRKLCKLARFSVTKDEKLKYEPYSSCWK